MDRDSILNEWTAAFQYVENIYNQADPIPEDWRVVFQTLDDSSNASQFSNKSSFSSMGEIERVKSLIEDYRCYGHLIARINPLYTNHEKGTDFLSLESYGFLPSEQKQMFPTCQLLLQEKAPLHIIYETLKKKYTGSIGFEFKKCTNKYVEEWIQAEIELGRFEESFTVEEKKIIAEFLIKSDLLENFLHTKHVGKKRFSLEGADTLIPMLIFLVNQAASQGVEEIFIGMAHRGRINVLAHILQKPLVEIFHDFNEEYNPTEQETGDIRYHKGFKNESVQTYQGDKIQLQMTSNPSHLESIYPVIEGQVHAKQFLAQDEEKREKIIPFVIHGDASISAQGIVYETLQLNRIPGFTTGGTLHLIINNQIGFTTSSKEGRSTDYCTAIAQTFHCPVFHVNAEDPEACVKVILFALEIRQKFHCDVFIDMYCYRKYGHNEGDEPSFTQPLMYQKIVAKKSIRNLYIQKLLVEKVLDEKQVSERIEDVKNELQNNYQIAQDQSKIKSNATKKLSVSFSSSSVETAVKEKQLQEIIQRCYRIPKNFHLHPKLEKLIYSRIESVEKTKIIDWAVAEALAFGTLLQEGISIRLVGQDSGRGTFSHRHALWIDQNNNQIYCPFVQFQGTHAKFEVLNSPLTEAGSLGFEYGYSTVHSKSLNLWEAQFGDFSNSAQVLIDQYLASGEQKWKQSTNLVLLLPHGFEGQGPEHSSARIERFLSLVGNNNMQIIYPSTPAQFFHALRRQAKQTILKPLVVFTPKSLLRHSACTSTLDHFTTGTFSCVLDHPQNTRKASNIVLCSGRIYYDLEAYRMEKKREDVAIIRIEQLYPLDENILIAILSTYTNVKQYQWVQEEPENMGAWSFIYFYLKRILPEQVPFTLVARERSASPATGYYARHQQEQLDLLHQVFKV